MSINAPMSSSMSPKVACFLAYFFSLIGGIIVLAVEKQNLFVRFHAMQAFLLGISAFVLNIALSVLQGILYFTPLYWVISLLSFGVSFGFLAVIIFMIIKSTQGQIVKLPVIGDIAERNSATFMR